MILTWYDHSGHKGEGEWDELGKDEHLHQQAKVSWLLMTAASH